VSGGGTSRKSEATDQKRDRRFATPESTAASPREGQGYSYHRNSTNLGAGSLYEKEKSETTKTKI